MHYLGVEHKDVEPQNVLQKRWSCLFKIIDFGFSDVDHTCPGWRECGELKDVWRKLQLDSVNNCMALEFKIRPVDYRSLLFIMLLLMCLAFVIIPGNPNLIPVVSEIHQTCVEYCTVVVEYFSP